MLVQFLPLLFVEVDTKEVLCGTEMCFKALVSSVVWIKSVMIFLNIALNQIKRASPVLSVTIPTAKRTSRVATFVQKDMEANKVFVWNVWHTRTTT